MQGSSLMEQVLLLFFNLYTKNQSLFIYIIFKLYSNSEE